ncbi:MAG: membrane dipeptidase [Candidatus Aminicenantes bacterium RBG_13_59_9]|nr:MAG: membrane dipeptidase [Candidatus Aminicenantes bacterium RBG_13_59_9]
MFQAGCRPELTEANLAAKARTIHDRVLTVDTHCDTASRLPGSTWDIGVRHEPGKQGSGKVDLPRMAEGGLDAEFFAVFVGQGERTEQGYAKAKDWALQTLAAIQAMCDRYPSLVGLALTPDDAYRLEKEGRRAAFIGMENGYPVGKTLSNLEEYYKLGVRYVTLCHSRDNDICDSSTDRRDTEDRGLSDFGREVVADCNRLGIMVDVSHASDKSFFDVLKVTKAPIIASHSSCRALCDSPRNLSDEMIRALAANGGVIQICFLSSYVRTPKPNPGREKALKELQAKYGARRAIQDEAVRKKAMEEYEALNAQYPEEKATVKELVDHIEHVINLVGIDYVGIGTDFDGGGGVEGCDDVSQMFRVTEELVRRGRTEKEIAKIWGGNIMRVFGRVIAVSRDLKS